MFQVGERVVLKSGGPVMTVSTVTNERVRCEWFDAGTLKWATFVRGSVEKYDPGF